MSTLVSRSVSWETVVRKRQSPPSGNPDITNVRLVWPNEAEIDRAYQWYVEYDVVNGDFPGGVAIYVQSSGGNPGNMYVLTDSGWQVVQPGSTVCITVFPGAEGHYKVPSMVKFERDGLYTGSVVLVGQGLKKPIIVRVPFRSLIGLKLRKYVLPLAAFVIGAVIGYVIGRRR